MVNSHWHVFFLSVPATLALAWTLGPDDLQFPPALAIAAKDPAQRAPMTLDQHGAHTHRAMAKSKTL